MKKKFMMLSCIAAVAIATVVGKKTYESHAYETSSLLMQNVEALTSTDNSIQGGYLVHHLHYYDPVTNIKTNKCTATSYMSPTGVCPTSHNHGATTCCTSPC